MTRRRGRGLTPVDRDVAEYFHAIGGLPIATHSAGAASVTRPR